MAPSSSRSTHWPKWTDVITYWKTLNVPDVEVRRWSPTRRNVACWDKKAEFDHPNHAYYTTSPEDQTAFHIVRMLPFVNEDLRVAFILEAFCRECGLRDFLSYVVRSVNRLHNCAPYGWWHANAKRVFPNAGDYWSERPRTESEEAKQWREIVHRAAVAWTTLARDWVVVRTPDLMDPNSQEYADYTDWAHIQHEERERAEYKSTTREIR